MIYHLRQANFRPEKTTLKIGSGDQWYTIRDEEDESNTPTGLPLTSVCPEGMIYMMFHDDKMLKSVEDLKYAMTLGYSSRIVFVPVVYTLAIKAAQ